MKKVFTILFCLTMSSQSSAQAKSPAIAAVQEIEIPQMAVAEDVRIFDPYIGKFRSSSKVFDDSTIEYFHTIHYQWFDKAKTTVKYSVAMEIPSQDRTVISSEGFYAFNPFENQLFVFGAFANRPSGWGVIGKFDHDTKARTIWAKSMDENGIVTHVRDGFEIIDQNSWKNKTSLRVGDEKDWKIVYEETYTCMPE